MKTNIFKDSENLSKKVINSEKAATKKAVNARLQDFSVSLESEWKKLSKDTDKRVRNLYNSINGRYKAAGFDVCKIVADMFPYQTAAGVLCTRRKNENGVKVWIEKRLTATAARGIIRDCMYNYIRTLGAPVVNVVVVGEPVQ